MRLIPRSRPCSSCPYRRDAPSGLWAPQEYRKLPGYDGSTAEQIRARAFGAFFCHHDDGQLCAGWVGCHDMSNNLGLRVAIAAGLNIDLDAVLAYVSPVPLFGSGAEAAAHGLRDLMAPGAVTRRRAAALRRMRERRESTLPIDSPPGARRAT
jgi:Family of unknown function (DUF6283)